MTAPALFDPKEGPQGGWPPAAASERAYLEAFGREDSRALISNLRTQVMGLRSGERIFPITVNEAEYGDAYVCLPHTAYALYARDELRIENAGAWTPALGLLASSAGALLRAARVNKIANLDNWMLSTNLHGDWQGEDVSEIRRVLTERFPDHMIAVRCLNDWSDSALLRRFREDGWKLLPARQIYVMDDLVAEWAPHRDAKRDLDLLAHTPCKIDTLEILHPGDAKRIADLYALLYLDRYSKLNPAFTEAYVEATHRAGILQYRGLRDPDGGLVAVAGCLVRGTILTAPIVGYDTMRPASEGLYRMTSALFARLAMERGLRLNGSAGAASFKRNRGARPVVEYTAFFVDHLSPFRRSVISAVGAALNRLAVPLVSERGL